MHATMGELQLFDVMAADNWKTTPGETSVPGHVWSSSRVFSHRNQDSDSIKMTHVSILKDIWGGDGLSYFTTKFGFLKPQPQKWSRRVLRNPFLILFPLSSFYVYLVMINNKILLVNLRVLSLKLQLEIRHAMTWNDCNILFFISKIPFHIINMW